MRIATTELDSKAFVEMFGFERGYCDAFCLKLIELGLKIRCRIHAPAPWPKTSIQRASSERISNADMSCECPVPAT